MREAVRFDRLSLTAAGGPCGYSKAGALKAILRYELEKGLRPDEREPLLIVGGEASNCQPPSGVSPADTP